MRTNSSLKKVKAKLVAMIDVTIEEAAKNPRFRKKLISTLKNYDQTMIDIPHNNQETKPTRKKGTLTNKAPAEKPTIAIYKELGEEAFLKYVANLDDNALLLICIQELGLKANLVKKMAKEDLCNMVARAMKAKLDKGRHFLSLSANDALDPSKKL